MREYEITVRGETELDDSALHVVIADALDAAGIEWIVVESG